MAKKKKESILIDDVTRQIAETRKVLADAQKSLAEKTAEVSNLKTRLKQLEKSAALPDVTESFTGKWFKSEDGTSADDYNKQYYYIIKDHGYKSFSDGTVYRKLTMFDLNMALWDCEDLCNNISVYRKIDNLFEPEELDCLIPVKQDEIKKEFLKKFAGILKILDGQKILPEELKSFITQKKRTKKNG